MRTLAEQAITWHHANQDEDSLTAFLAWLPVRGSILEIGSYCGGTLWLWSRVFARVTAITLPSQCASHPFDGHGARVIWGDSHDWHDVGLVDVVFHDGDHSTAGIVRDLCGYPAAWHAIHDIYAEAAPAWARLRALPGTCEFGGRLGIGVIPGWLL